MTDTVEGVTPAASESVADIKEVAAPAVSEASPKEGEEQAENAVNQESDLDDDLFEKIKASKRVQKWLDENVDQKTARQKAANRQLQRQYEEANAELGKFRSQKPLETPKMDDFKTMEEYQDALAEHKAEVKFREKQEQEAQQRVNEQSQAQLAEQRNAFVEKEAEVIKADPEYHTNTAVVQSYLDMLPKDQNGAIQDPGYKAFAEHMAFESENGPALLNHLGKNPEKIEALFGKPPAYIKNKLAQYEKEINDAPKSPEIKQPLPKPPIGVRPGSRTEKSVENMSADDLLKAVRS